MRHILPPLEIWVDETYIDLLQRTGQDLGVDQSDLSEILEIERGGRPEPIKGKGCKWHLSIHKRYPIKFAGEGIVFEIRGRSDTNKTFSLAYLGTLLGVDWDSLRTFLQDSKMMERAQEAIQSLSQGQRASLLIKTASAELNIEVKAGQARVTLKDVEINDFLHGLDGSTLSLRSGEDWEAYRTKLSGIVDVQIVAKRRNFVHQVGLDEGRDLATFAKHVSDRCTRLFNHLEKVLPAERPTIATQTDLENMRTELEQKREELQNHLDDIRNRRNAAIADAEQAKEFRKLRRELDSPRVEEYAKASRELQIAEETHNGIESLRSELERNEVILEELESELGQLTNRLESVDAALGEAASSTETLLPKLVELIDEGDALLANLQTKHIEHVLSLTQGLQLDEETLDIYRSLIEALNGRSVAVALVPLASTDGTSINNLGQLKALFEQHLRTASDQIQLCSIVDKLKPKLENPDYPVTTAEEYLNLGNQIDDIRTTIAGLRDQVESESGEIKRKEELLSEILGGKSLDEKRAALETQRVELAEESLHKVKELEEMADQLGLQNPWESLLSLTETVHSITDRSESEAKRLNEERRNVEAQLKSIDDEVEQLGSTVVAPETRSRRASRLDALERFKETAVTIQQYVDKAQHIFEEEGRMLEDVEYADYKKALGKYFDWMIEVLSQRILDRCPERYVNRGMEVSREPVQGYDFIRGRPLLAFGEDEGSGGGEDSAMTVRGLASKEGTSVLGTILLVDEFGDAVDTFGDVMFGDLANLPRLSLAVIVDQQKDLGSAKMFKHA